MSVRIPLATDAEMKQYLRVDEKFKEWEELEMVWIHHHNPDLVILAEDGKTEKERIDLQGLTAAKMDALLKDRGFKRR